MWNDLMPRIAHPDNLYSAWRRIRANRGVAGVDAVSLSRFEMQLDTHLEGLARRLQDDSYFPQPLRRTTIPKSDGGERPLGIPTVVDRVAQRAFVNVLEPLFESVFLPCSFGYRPERSVEQAVQSVMRYRAAGHVWLVDADVERFFDTVHHDLLMERLRGYIGDRSVLRTIRMWVEAGAMTEGRAEPASGFWHSTSRQLRDIGKHAVGELLGEEAATFDPAPRPLPDDDPEEAANAWDEADREARRRALCRVGREAAMLAYTFRDVWKPLLRRRGLMMGGGIGLAVAGAVLVGRQVAVCARQRSERAETGGSGPSGAMGTPQGSPLSPLLANIYLHDFDAGLLRENLHLVRYADDFVVCCATERRAEFALQVAEKELGRLRLHLNPEKTGIREAEEPFVFLGHQFDSEGTFPLKTSAGWGIRRGRDAGEHRGRGRR